MSALRVFALGGLMSYRALFAWITPGLFVATMIATPLFQILFFALLGPALSDRPVAFFVVGSAIQTSAMAGVHGMTQSIVGERQFGTLGTLIISPANRLALFLGRTVPHIGNGILVVLLGFGFGIVLLRVRLPADAWWPIAVALTVTALSCTAFGLLLGAVGLVYRDMPFITNVVYLSLLLVTGATVPLELLPRPIAWMSSGVPLTAGISAAREAAERGASPAWRAAVLAELLVAMIYLVVGYTALRLLERAARRSGGLELF